MGRFHAGECIMSMSTPWVLGLAAAGLLAAAGPARALPGFLRLVSVEPAPPVDPEWLATSPDGRHVYVVGNVTNAVAAYARNAASGALTLVEVEQDGVNGTEGIAGARAVAVSPDGAHVYVAGTNEHALAVFVRDAGTGALDFLEVHRDGEAGVEGLGGAFALTVSPDGAHVYAAALGDNALTVFARDAGSGALSFVEAKIDGVGGVDGLAAVSAVAVSPDGAHVYTASLGDDAVAAFARDAGTGALTFVNAVRDGDSGVDGLDNGESVVVSPDGAHVYAAGSGDHAIAVFARDAGTGTLTQVQVVRDGDPGIDGLFGVHAIALAPDGSALYAAGSGDNALTMFARDAATGRLDLLDIARDGIDGVEQLAGAEFVAVTPDDRHIYVTSTFDDAVLAFDVRCGDGVIDPGEQCDDGGHHSGDGCSVGCAVEFCFECSGEPSTCVPGAEGTTCDSSCATGGTCSGGICVGGTPSACDPCQRCDLTIGECVLDVRTTCRRSLSPTGSVLKLKNRAPRPTGSVSWKWVHGEATSTGDFGDPLGGDNYALCLFDDTGQTPALLFRAVAPGSGSCRLHPCWSNPGADFRYADPDTTPDGVKTLLLRAGSDRQSHIRLKAKGPALVGRPHALPLTPLPTALTLQLQASSGACFESRYGPGGVVKNAGGIFKARAAE